MTLVLATLLTSGHALAQSTDDDEGDVTPPAAPSTAAPAQPSPPSPPSPPPGATPPRPVAAAPTAPAADPAPSSPPRPPRIPVSSETSEERKQSIVPTAAETPPHGPIMFAADPIADGGIILGAAAFAGLLEIINGTGEIRPQQIAPNFNVSNLLAIDRIAVRHTPDNSALILSNVGLFVAAGYAVLDPIFTAVREKHVQAGIVDAIIYAEAATITWGITNLAKMAVRRPRPRAYLEAEQQRDNPDYSNSDTDSSLSFFSGHASMTAAITTTATYLAFARSPHSWRPWVTMGVGGAITAFTSFERVRGGAHFPTDVIAGTIAGAGVGMIVAHLHRNEDVKQRRVWVGYAPDTLGGRGGQLQLGGMF